MPIEFGTVKLNKRLYRKMVWYILFELFQHDVPKTTHFYKNWNIEIFDTEYTDLDYFKHFKTTNGQRMVKGIPSGHTGIRYIGLWLILIYYF